MPDIEIVRIRQNDYKMSGWKKKNNSKKNMIRVGPGLDACNQTEDLSVLTESITNIINASSQCGTQTALLD